MLTWRLALLVSRLFDLYQLMIVVWCVLSWVPRGGGLIGDVRSVLGRLVEPWLALFRRVLPPFGGIDFSPVVAIVALQLLARLIQYILV